MHISISINSIYKTKRSHKRVPHNIKTTINKSLTVLCVKRIRLWWVFHLFIKRTTDRKSFYFQFWIYIFIHANGLFMWSIYFFVFSKFFLSVDSFFCSQSFFLISSNNALNSQRNWEKYVKYYIYLFDSFSKETKKCCNLYIFWHEKFDLMVSFIVYWNVRIY